MMIDRTSDGYCHPVGMLDRDHRTAKLPIFSEHVVVATFNGGFPRTASQIVLSSRTLISHRAIPGRASPHSSCKTRKNAAGHLWKCLMQRLEHALVVGTCITLIALLPCISTAPTNRPSMDPRRNSHPKWMNPLGIDFSKGQDAAYESRQVTNAQLISQILYQANTAYSRTRQFGEKFVTRTFKKSWDEHHNLWKDTHYKWLPTEQEIPKNLDEPVPSEHLETIKFQDALLNTYTYLQQIAVGLEQIVWDMEDQNDPFLTYFKETENQIRTLLCEIQVAIIEHDIEMKPDVQRDIMGEELRNLDTTNSNIRNWVIYRDCLNVLEYVREVFQYLKSKM